MGWLQTIFGKRQVQPKLDQDRILRAYGAVLESSAAEMISDEKALPLPKNQLASILVSAIASTKNNELRETLKVAYVSLAKFVTLDDSQWLKVEAFENASTSKDAEDIDQLISAIADSGDTYTEVMNRIQSEMATLRTDLQKRGLW